MLSEAEIEHIRFDSASGTCMIAPLHAPVDVAGNDRTKLQVVISSTSFAHCIYNKFLGVMRQDN